MNRHSGAPTRTEPDPHTPHRRCPTQQHPEQPRNRAVHGAGPGLVSRFPVNVAPELRGPRTPLTDCSKDDATTPPRAAMLARAPTHTALSIYLPTQPTDQPFWDQWVSASVYRAQRSAREPVACLPSRRQRHPFSVPFHAALTPTFRCQPRTTKGCTGCLLHPLVSLDSAIVPTVCC